MNYLNKHIISLIILIMAFAVSRVNGQDDANREKIEAQRSAFITGKLGLTPQEAQQFWPVYNEYLNKKQELQQQKKEIMRQAMLNIDGITEKEMEKMLEDYTGKDMEIAKLDEEYMVKLKAIISPKKVMQLYIAEIQFKNFLLKQIRDDRSQPRPNRR